MAQSPASISSKSAQLRFHLRWLIPLFLVGLLLIQPVRVGLNLYQSFATVRQLSSALRAVEQPSDLQAVQSALSTLGVDMAHLRANIAPMMPILSLLGFVPRVGPLLTHAEEVAAIGEESVLLLNQVVKLAQKHWQAEAQPEEFRWPLLGPILTPLADDFAALETKFTALPLAQMDGRIGDYLRQANAVVEMAQGALAVANEWPELLGTTRPATYLIIVQNNHELRSTGGFISAVAPATLVNGSLRKVEFVDSYAIFTEGLAYPPAPAPMRFYMGIELLTLRDANWSPDFPSSAQVIRTLYQQHTGLAVDGVISVDLDAVGLLLPAFGSLTLAGVPTPVTQANVEQALVQLWNDPSAAQVTGASAAGGDWWTQRKDFIGQLTQAAFARLQQGSVNPAALAAGVVAALDQRSVQVWLANSAGEELMAEHTWDGGLHPTTDRDFLAVVDMNMGYNKVDAVLTRALDYSVTWPDDPALGAEATLTLTYTHPVNVTDPVCRAEAYYGERYQDMMARCYFDYSRVYVPGGSELLAVEGWIDATVTSQRAEQGTQQFAGYFILNPGTKHQVRLRYRLPPTVQPSSYELVLQRQAGTDALDIILQSGEERLQTKLVQGLFKWSPMQESSPR